jgi:hypothetical protein
MTKTHRLSLFVIGISALALTACANREHHYWQKTDPNTALYLTGVKAQQMLEQDIAECVHEVIELTKLSDVRMKTPAVVAPLGSYDQKQATDEMSNLPYWDVPEYIRDLRVDHTDYHDFDGCMAHKGWTRVKYVGPEVERHADNVYDDTANYSVRPSRASVEAYRREKDALNTGR